MTKQSSTLYGRWLMLAVAMLFLALSILSATNSALEYDEGYNATVSKNLVWGLGYATSFPELKHFNPEISTGPALLLPVALLVKTCGNKHWVPGVTNALISIPLLTLLFFLVGNSLKSTWKYFSLPLFLACCYGVGIIGFFSTGLGETGAAVATLLGQFFFASALINDNVSRKRTFGVLSGVLFAVALLFKYIAAIQIGVTIFVATVMFLHPNRKNFVQPYLCCLISLLLVIMAYVLVISANAQISEHLQFFNSRGSGVSTISETIGNLEKFVKQNFLRNVPVITFNFGGLISLVTVFAIASLGVFHCLLNCNKRSVAQQAPQLNRAATGTAPFFTIFTVFVFSGVVAGLCWFFLLNESGWIRHALPTVLQLLFLTCISPFVSNSKRFTFALIALCIVVVNLGFTHDRRYSTVPPGYPHPPNTPITVLQTYNSLHLTKTERLREQISAVATIATLSAENNNHKLLGCTWWVNRAMEYLLPNSKNFTECSKYNGASDSQIKSDLSTTNFLVIDLVYWNWDTAELNGIAMKHCSDRLSFITSNQQYIARCW